MQWHCFCLGFSSTEPFSDASQHGAVTFLLLVLPTDSSHAHARNADLKRGSELFTLAKILHSSFLDVSEFPCFLLSSNTQQTLMQTSVGSRQVSYAQTTLLGGEIKRRIPSENNNRCSGMK
jgi:hypothetical protein